MFRILAALLLTALFAAPLAAADAPLNAVLGDLATLLDGGVADETEAIARHLALVEHLLRQRRTPELSEDRRRARARVLDRLADYRRARAFPVNEYVARRAPVFVDAGGRRCAVAAIAEPDVGAALIRRIAARQRLAFIGEIEAPELARWAEANGFALLELAMIQPGYPGGKGNTMMPPPKDVADRMTPEEKDYWRKRRGWFQDDGSGERRRLSELDRLLLGPARKRDEGWLDWWDANRERWVKAPGRVEGDRGATVAALARVVADESAPEDLRRFAAIALAKIGGAAEAAQLRAQLKGSAGALRANLLIGLGLLGDAKHADVLREGLEAKEPIVRRQAAIGLGALGVERGRLLALARDRKAQADVRVGALVGLSQMRHPEIADAAAALLKDTRLDRRLRAWSAYCLARQVPELAAPLFLEYVKARKRDVRLDRQVMLVLTGVRSPRLVPLLRAALRGRDAEVRAHAALALAHQGDRTQTRLLVRLLAATDADWQPHVALALGVQGDESALRALRAYGARLRKRRDGARLSASLVARAMMGDATLSRALGAPVWHRFRRSGPWVQGAYACSGVTSTRPHVDAVAGCLDAGMDASLARECAAALGDESHARLAQAARKGSLAAILALAELRRPDAEETLRAVLADEKQTTARVVAAAALGHLYDRTDAGALRPLASRTDPALFAAEPDLQALVRLP